MKQEVLVRNIGEVLSLCESWRRGELPSRDFKACYLAAVKFVEPAEIADDVTERLYDDAVLESAEIMLEIKQRGTGTEPPMP